MKIVGIDPGKSGAVAVINEKEEVLLLVDMPTDVQTYVDVIRCNEIHSDAVFLEQVHAMPGQGVTSMFTFGQNYGKAELLAKAFGPVTYVTPQTWKKGMNLVREKDEDKTAYKHRSIETAKKLFPEVEKYLTASKDGRAEALLIAYYGLTKSIDKETKTK